MSFAFKMFAASFFVSVFGWEAGLLVLAGWLACVAADAWTARLARRAAITTVSGNAEAIAREFGSGAEYAVRDSLDIMRDALANNPSPVVYMRGDGYHVTIDPGDGIPVGTLASASHSSSRRRPIDPDSRP